MILDDRVEGVVQLPGLINWDVFSKIRSFLGGGNVPEEGRWVLGVGSHWTVLLAANNGVAQKLWDDMLCLECREGGRVEIARALIACGADVHMADPVYGDTPLRGACLNGHVEVARLLGRINSSPVAV